MYCSVYSIHKPLLCILEWFVGFEEADLFVKESESPLEVCLTTNTSYLSRNVSVTISTMDLLATGKLVIYQRSNFLPMR